MATLMVGGLPGKPPAGCRCTHLQAPHYPPASSSHVHGVLSWNNLILKQTTLDKAIAAGEVKVTGNGDKLKEVLGYMDNFEFWFNIVTP